LHETQRGRLREVAGIFQEIGDVVARREDAVRAFDDDGARVGVLNRVAHRVIHRASQRVFLRRPRHHDAQDIADA
jgi:hypothetical protein